LADNKTYEYDCVFNLLRIEYDLPKFWTPVMALSRAEINYFRKLGEGYFFKHDNKKIDNENIDFGNKPETYFGKKNIKEVIENPILGNTKLVSLLDSLEIYKSLDSYLRSLHNDVTQESDGLTDTEKAENKGFNKIESFRNIHPRT